MCKSEVVMDPRPTREYGFVLRGQNACEYLSLAHIQQKPKMTKEMPERASEGQNSTYKCYT